MAGKFVQFYHLVVTSYMFSIKVGVKLIGCDKQLQTRFQSFAVGGRGGAQMYFALDRCRLPSCISFPAFRTQSVKCSISTDAQETEEEREGEKKQTEIPFVQKKEKKRFAFCKQSFFQSVLLLLLSVLHYVCTVLQTWLFIFLFHCEGFSSFFYCRSAEVSL